MIGVDTNLIVRIVARDDATQSPAAKEFVTREFEANGPVFVNSVVLAELVWVLESRYGFGAVGIASAVGTLLDSDEFRVDEAEATRTALAAYAREGKGFADLLIAQLNLTRGCRATATFDKRAAKSDGFVLVR